MNSLFFNIISKYKESSVNFDYKRQGIVAKLPDEIEEYDLVLLKGLEFELEDDGNWFLTVEKFNRISIGLSEDWPDFINETIVKKGFMWLHDKGFEGERNVVIKRSRKKVYFIHIERPPKWSDRRVQDFTTKFARVIESLINK